jgi:hypothetical protein
MGAFDALNTLRTIGRALHAWVVPEQASVPEGWMVFNLNGSISMRPRAIQRPAPLQPAKMTACALSSCWPPPSLWRPNNSPVPSTLSLSSNANSG